MTDTFNEGVNAEAVVGQHVLRSITASALSSNKLFAAPYVFLFIILYLLPLVLLASIKSFYCVILILNLHINDFFDNK